jgi:hypothetical protein
MQGRRCGKESAMLRVVKSFWRNRWHVYEIDSGVRAWLATFRTEEAAVAWIHGIYNDDE